MKRRHEGRVALITGGAAGIGQAIARCLAAEGAKIVVLDIADARETVALAKKAGSDAIGVVGDVSDGECIREAKETAFAQFGKVDILVHNAGIYPFTPFSDLTFAQWRNVMSVNLDSMYHLLHEFLPGMRARGWGRVICMTSGTLYTGTPNLSHYIASKGALFGLVRGLAGEIGADGVTINAIAPGLVASHGTLSGPHNDRGLFDRAINFQAIKRTLGPDDLTGALSFLASDEAAFMTGQSLLVDGGSARN